MTNPVLPETPPKTWLWENIMATIFCCLPIGLIGILYARRVEPLYYQGDVVGAERLSKIARNFFILALCGGLVISIGLTLSYLELA